MAPIVCAICGQKLIAHFTADGEWSGCYDLIAGRRALVLSEPRLMVAGVRPAEDGGERARSRYKVAPVSRRKKSAVDKLRGKTRQLFILLAEDESAAFTKRELAERTRMNPSTVEFGLWKLKGEGLVDVLPA